MGGRTNEMVIRQAALTLLGVAGVLTALSCSSGDITNPTGPKYRVIDLGSLSTGHSSSARDINSAGQVVGTASVPDLWPGATHGFLWESGVMTDITPVGEWLYDWVSEVAAINPAGKVVGRVNTSGFRHTFPWLWEQGVLTGLGNGEGYATDINPAGQVVGCLSRLPDAFTECHAVLWDNGATTDLGTLAGGVSEAYGIDPTGRVVGRSDGHAFLWEKGVMTDLNIPGGESIARRINAAGQVVGEVSVGSVTHGFLWEKGSITDLGEVFQVSDINARGQVVGSRSVAGTAHAFVWENGIMTDLPGPSQAFGINDAGQIVGDIWRGTSPARATLWTPK
jgi:probable HAF family extracellular repeat protein